MMLEAQNEPSKAFGLLINGIVSIKKYRAF